MEFEYVRQILEEASMDELYERLEIAEPEYVEMWQIIIEWRLGLRESPVMKKPEEKDK